jgi:hypothetical protein
MRRLFVINKKLNEVMKKVFLFFSCMKLNESKNSHYCCERLRHKKQTFEQWRSMLSESNETRRSIGSAEFFKMEGESLRG